MKRNCKLRLAGVDLEDYPECTGYLKSAELNSNLVITRPDHSLIMEPMPIIKPNPFYSTIEILDNDNYEVKNVEIFTENGNLVYKSEFSNLSPIIDLSNLPSGLFIYKAYDLKGNQYVTKIIKE